MADWPLVGRVEELRQLRRIVTDPARNGAVLAGPPGVGKTRLALECLRLAESAHLQTARTTATRAAAGLPFGALAPLLPADDFQPGAVDERDDLLRRFTTRLLARAASQRMVLFVDDAHLLDDASATLLHQIAAANAASVLVTVRTGLPAPDPVLALWKDELVERIEIGTLSDEAVEELIPAAVGGPVDPAAVTELAARCRGNALFLRELLIGALQDGTLRDEDGLWRLRGALTPSDRLAELVDSRLGELTTQERALLELVAMGEPLGKAELLALSDPAVAESLERRALLTSDMNERRLEVRLTHPLYGEVLRDRLPTVRVQAIARSLAETIENAGARRREDVLRVASWRLTGGGGHPDVLLAGARAARWRYDFPLGERLARAAADAGAGFEAALLAAQLAGLQGRSAEADQELADLARRATTDAERGTVALIRLDSTVLWTGGDPLGIVSEAEATITDPGWRDELQARVLGMLLSSQGTRATIEAARPLLARAKEGALAFACLSAAFSLGRHGRLDEAIDISVRGHASQMATRRPLAWYPWWHLFERCLALNYAGRFVEAERLAIEQYRQGLADRSLEAQGIFALTTAVTVAERGHLHVALPRIREALAVNQQLGRPLLLRMCHIFGALGSALGGQQEDARQSLDALAALGVPGDRLIEADAIQARAWLAVAAGNLPEARRLLEEAADFGEDDGDLVGAASALHGLARLGRAAEVRDRLATVAGQIDGVLAPARLAHADALVRHDPAALDTVSRQFQAMGAELLAAEAATDAAVAQRRTGHRVEAIEWRASTLAERCAGVATPALQGVEARVRLTAAERETALLAAAGHSNKEIAEELHLSVRTVENRLQRVYEKLGISKRTAIGPALDA